MAEAAQDERLPRWVTTVVIALLMAAIANGVVKDMLVNERLQLEIRGPNGAVVTITFGQFGIWR